MMTRAVFALIGVALIGAAIAGVSRPASAIGVTRTWTGGDATNNTWSDPDNWDTGAPTAGDLLVFPQAAARKANTNDFPANTLFESITFTGSGYTISGNDLELTAGLENQPASGVNVVDLDVGGAGALANVSGRLVLAGDNSYAGLTHVIGGELSAEHDNALGSSAAGTAVESGATLQVTGSVDLSPESVEITGNGFDGFGALQSPFGQNRIGTVEAQDDVTVGVFNSTLIVDHLGSTPTTPQLTLIGGGKLQVESSTFVGPITVLEGNLTWNASSQAFVDILQHGWLRGLGTVATAHALSGLIWPGSGNAPGILTVFNETVFSGGGLKIDLDGPLPGSGHGQLRTTGLTLTSNATLLDVELGYVPLIGEVFLIVDNEGGEIDGTFFGLPEGAVFNAGGYAFAISYKGGDGNDITLTVLRQVTADLKLTMTASPSPVSAGSLLTYSVTLTNLGPDAASSPRISLGTPVGTTFEDVTGPANWVCSLPAPSVNVTCTGPAFASGATANFTVVFRVNNGATGPISATAGVSSETNDPVSSNNAVTVNTNIGSGGALGFRLVIPGIARD